ncbi:Noc2-domain-containing protein [Pseudovirgaria hyperparasitica]|uniref:Noc2-domain-containing protein n=1 Tax=Pseudovirgaria hyperparasitica TaxID=470096 RepID=A0A6A6VV84_9PEZI|nr:Noc2-domain-containing protein [Pseudovirgaria hyperparasitica]KAF2753177.1 Noc2-domain-containing protein [Pseudovirgaria hyperparasitica]
MPQSKATKKFEKNRLGDVLKRRKEFKKIKQREQKNAKRKERAREDGETDGNDAEKKRSKPNDDALNSMSVDDFFAGGFEIPQDPKNRKRKRTMPPEDESVSTKNHEDTERVEVPVDTESDSDDGLTHQEQLSMLAKNQPEFFKNLQDEAPKLLDFDEDAEMDGLVFSDSEADDSGNQTKKKSALKKAEEDSSEDEDKEMAKEVKIPQVKQWTKSMLESNSLRTAREVVTAFRAATRIDDEDSGKFKYTISDSEAYHALIMTALKNIPTLLQHQVPYKERSDGRIQLSTESKKFKTVSPIIKTFVNSIQQLLEDLSDDATLRVTLTAVQNVAPYTLTHKKLVKDLVKSIVEIWSDASNSEAARIAAFLVLRKYTVIGDTGIRESVLRATYQGLVKGSRNTTIHTIQGVNLMKNSAAELWGIDAGVGYTTGFTFIRQLAIHLRSSITKKENESYKKVYNWQYVHSLDFWSRVISLFCDNLREAMSGKESPLRPLIYPVVQVTLGALRLIPTSQYFPLRFQLIRSLLRITRTTGTYIPLAASLYEVLNSAEMRKAPKPSTLKALDFSINIRTPASYLRTRIYQEGVGEQVVELFSEFLVQWARSIAFPELALPVIVMLKRWLKETGSKASGNKNGKVNGGISLLVQKLEANSKWIEEKRAKVEFAPENRAGVDGFLKECEFDKSPLGAYVVTQRKQREEKQKIIEQARRDAENDRKAKTNMEDQEEADGVEINGDDDSDEEVAEQGKNSDEDD